VAFGPDEERDHSFWYKDNYRKKLFFYFSKCIKNIMQHIFAAEILLVHIMVKDL
jgi:hypothetical protein